LVSWRSNAQVWASASSNAESSSPTFAAIALSTPGNPRFPSSKVVLGATGLPEFYARPLQTPNPQHGQRHHQWPRMQLILG
jgi:hypothetical protein